MHFLLYSRSIQIQKDSDIESIIEDIGKYWNYLSCREEDKKDQYQVHACGVNMKLQPDAS